LVIADVGVGGESGRRNCQGCFILWVVRVMGREMLRFGWWGERAAGAAHWFTTAYSSEGVQLDTASPSVAAHAIGLVNVGEVQGGRRR